MSQTLSRNEKQNKTTGIIIAVLFHAAILLICWFWIAWMTPIPPETQIPEGVTIGFGTGDPEGGGDGSLTSNGAPAAAEQTDYTPADPSETPTPTTTPTTASSTPTPPVVTGHDPSAAPAPKPTTPAPITHGMKPASPGTGTAGTTTGATGTGPGQGTGSGSTTGGGVGGNGGTGGSMNHTISGWKWKDRPDPQPCAKTYTGKVTFKVTLDGNSGKIETITPKVTNGIPPSVVDCLSDLIQRQALFEEVGNTNVNSSGEITITLNYAQ